MIDESNFREIARNLGIDDAHSPEELGQKIEYLKAHQNDANKVWESEHPDLVNVIRQPELRGGDISRQEPVEETASEKQNKLRRLKRRIVKIIVGRVILVLGFLGLLGIMFWHIFLRAMADMSSADYSATHHFTDFWGLYLFAILIVICIGCRLSEYQRRTFFTRTPLRHPYREARQAYEDYKNQIKGGSANHEDEENQDDFPAPKLGNIASSSFAVMRDMDADTCEAAFTKSDNSQDAG